MVHVSQVQLCASLGTAEAIQRLSNQWWRVAILDDMVVETSIVDVEAEAPVTFTDELYGSTSRRIERSDKPTSGVPFDVSLQSL